MGLTTGLLFASSILFGLAGCGSYWWDTKCKQLSGPVSSIHWVHSAKVGDGSYNKKSINSINLSWTAGDVTIVESDENELKIKENLHGKNVNDNQKMHWGIHKGKLIITPVKPGENPQSNVKRDLTIYVPKGLSDFTINLISCDAKYDNITSEELNLNLMSSDVEMGLLKCKKVSVNGTTSDAKIKLLGKLGATVFANGTAINSKGNVVYGNGNCKISIKGTALDYNILNE